MKIAIIGAGHIGSAIVTCLAQGHLYNEKDIIVSNPNIDKSSFWLRSLWTSGFLP